MSDLDIIKKIEKELKVKLEEEELDIITWDFHGYTLDKKGNVTGLGLFGCETKIVDRIISPLKELKNLTILNLSNNQLTDISPLKELKNLTILNLDDNQLTDISPLKELDNLTQLELGGIQLTNISPLKELKNLTRLGLSLNQLTDIYPLKELKNLTELNLRRNQLTDISPLKELDNLTRLNLKDNQLTDISPLKELKNLKLLDLRSNPIEELPAWIADFVMGIKWTGTYKHNGILFYDNPLKSPPPEIVKQGKEAVRNYFDQIREQTEDYLFEAKMLVVGEPGAGKTSMVWKMEDAECQLPGEKETTMGIDVRQYHFPLRKDDFPAFKYPDKLEGGEFRVNLWDFGGQEIYKATHRFFLSRRSIYALVADSRNEDADFNYWLHIVEMFGGDSPLLIVLNEKHGRRRNIDITEMKKRFENISDVKDVDFAEADKTRLEDLKKAIRYFISKCPHVGSPVPAKWKVIREALEENKHSTITLQEYLDICRTSSIDKTKDALVLSQYFHDIGVFLHFHDDPLLKKIIFLKPNWATHAVYKILDHDLIKRQNGRFNRDDAKVIWSEEEYDLIREELLKLMQKFFLTYRINGSNEYIVPEHLPAEQPAYDWDENDNLFLRYKYDLFMPKGIMSLFTVRMHRYISDHNNVWKRGVMLERQDTLAEIIETYDARAIKIRISGKNSRDFMTIITEELDRINGQYEKMKVDKMIPCNCDNCRQNAEPYFFEHDKLKRRLENNIDNIECESSFKRVNIKSLMDQVIGEKSMRKKVFISYSHKDKKWLDLVRTHLKVLENEGVALDLWDDTKIKAGMKWRNEIEKALKEAKAAILLVSTDFLASDFITKYELPHLLKAAENEGVSMLPLILKPCRFEKHKELSEFQAINEPSRPLVKLSGVNRDDLLVKMVGRIEELML